MIVSQIPWRELWCWTQSYRLSSEIFLILLPEKPKETEYSVVRCVVQFQRKRKRRP